MRLKTKLGLYRPVSR